MKINKDMKVKILLELLLMEGVVSEEVVLIVENKDIWQKNVQKADKKEEDEVEEGEEEVLRIEDLIIFIKMKFNEDNNHNENRFNNKKMKIINLPEIIILNNNKEIILNPHELLNHPEVIVSKVNHSQSLYDQQISLQKT